MIDRSSTSGVLVITWPVTIIVVRRPDKAYAPGALSVPGGWIEQGESPIVAGSRELREETGIIASDFSSVSVVNGDGLTTHVLIAYPVIELPVDSELSLFDRSEFTRCFTVRAKHLRAFISSWRALGIQVDPNFVKAVEGGRL